MLRTMQGEVAKGFGGTNLSTPFFMLSIYSKE